METSKAPEKVHKQQEDVTTEAYTIITNSKYPKEIREFASNVILAFTKNQDTGIKKHKLEIKCFYRREEPRVVDLHEHMPFTKYKSNIHGDRPYRIEIPREIEFKSYEYSMILNWKDRKRSIQGEGVYYEQ